MKIRFNIENVLYILALMLATLAMATGFWGIEFPLSLYQYSIYLIAVWYSVILYRTLGGVARLRNLVIFFVYIVFFTFFVLSNHGDSFLKGISYIVCLFFMHITLQRKMSENMMRGFFLIAFAGSIGLLSSWIFTKESYFGLTRTILEFNPQSVGCWAYLLGASMLILKDKVRCFWGKAISVLIACMMFYITKMTDTKSGIYAFFILFILSIFPPLKILTKPMVASLSALIPAVLSILSVWSYESGFTARISKKGTFFTGREIIWSNDFQVLNEHFFLGDYKNYMEQYTHNIFVEHIVLYGVPLAIFFIGLMGYALYRMAIRMSCKLNYMAYIAFIGALLVSSMEGMVFSTGCGGALLYAMSFLFLMGYTPKQKSQKQEKLNSK